MAKGRSYPEEEANPQAAVEGPTSVEPDHEDPGQEHWPEDKEAKKERLLKRAQAEAEGKTVEAKKSIVVKYGLNHITYLIEQNKAQLVVIAHDVDPIELVGYMAPCLVQEDGDSLLHCEGEVSAGSDCPQENGFCLVFDHGQE